MKTSKIKIVKTKTTKILKARKTTNITTRIITNLITKTTINTTIKTNIKFISNIQKEPLKSGSLFYINFLIIFCFYYWHLEKSKYIVK